MLLCLRPPLKREFTSMCSICLRWVFLYSCSWFRASSSWVLICMLSLYSTENCDCRHLYSVVSRITLSGKCWSCTDVKHTKSSLTALVPCGLQDHTFRQVQELHRHKEHRILGLAARHIFKTYWPDKLKELLFLYIFKNVLCTCRKCAFNEWERNSREGTLCIQHKLERRWICHTKLARFCSLWVLLLPSHCSCFDVTPVVVAWPKTEKCCRCTEK